jgi:hypothetical protein
MIHISKAKVILSVLVTALALLALQPSGYARAQGNPTPTPVPPSQDIVPGASPTPGTGGGLLIPTSTPSGGLIIPTSTPAEPSFPTLTDVQLQAINLQPADVPPDFAANQDVKTFTAEGMIADLNNAGASELAEAFQQITATYGWQFSVGITYTSCQPNLPINKIYSEVGQFSSPSTGRRFFDDPQVQDFFAALGYSLSPAENVHGWRATYGPDTGACFPQETEYAVFFEYWGLMLTVSMTANANTDPQLVWSLVDQLIPIVIAHADAQATQPFPATPIPVAVILVPTPPTPVATPAPPATPTSATEWATLQDIDAAMLTLNDLKLSTPPWMLVEDESGISKPEEISYWYRYGGLNDIADAFDSASQRAGMIGRVSRAWYTGGDCSQDWDYLEINVDLFNDSNGPTILMNDTALQEAWLHTPYNNYDSIEPHTIGNVPGQIWSGVSPYSHCGLRVIHDLVMPHGRFLITVQVIGSPSFESAMILFGNNFATLAAYRLDQAGLQ